MSEKVKPNQILLANLAQYQLYANCLAGGNSVRWPDSGTLDPFAPRQNQESLSANNGGYCAYLWKYPAEYRSEFEVRLRQSVFPNYCQEVVSAYQAHLFASPTPIDRSAIIAALPDSEAENIDLRGSSLDAFWRSVGRERLGYGWVGVLIDRTKPTREYSSLYEQQSDSSNRAYLRMVVPQAVYDWSFNADGSFYYVIIKDSEIVDDNPTFRIWTAVDCTHITHDFKVLEEVRHDYGFVPFEIIVCDQPPLDDPHAPFGLSAIRDAAPQNIEIYNRMSMYGGLMDKTNYPNRVLKGANPNDKIQSDKDMGAGDLIFAPPGGDMTWIAPPPTCPEQSRADIDFLVRQLRAQAGIAVRSEESVEAHSAAALQWEYATKISLVKLRAKELLSGEQRVMRKYAIVSGYDIPWNSIRYPEEYVAPPSSQDLADYKSMADAGLPGEILEAQLREIVLRRFSHRPNVQELMDSLKKVNEEEKQEELQEDVENQGVDEQDKEDKEDKEEEEVA